MSKNDENVEKPYYPMYVLGMASYFFSTGQAARELGVPQSTIRTLCSGGAIAAETTPGGQWRIPQEEVYRLKENGIPVVPRAMPEGTAAASRATRNNQAALLADPSEATISAADEVIRLESEVKAVGLKRQLEEGRDWFRERDEQEEEKEALLDRQSWERESRAIDESKRRTWRDKWLQYALARKPWEAPQDAQLDIHREVDEALAKLHPAQPEQLVIRLVDAAIEKAVKPWIKRKERERAVQAACDRLPWAMRSGKEGAVRKHRAERATSEALDQLGPDATASAMEATSEFAVRPLIVEFEHSHRCEQFANSALQSLNGATRQELEDAKQALAEVVGTLPMGATDRQIEQACDTSLRSLRTALTARQDQATRAEVLKWTKFTIALSPLPQRSEATAMELIRKTIDSLPQGTPERGLRAAVDKVIDRLRENQRRQERLEESKRSLIEGGLRQIFPYLQRLNEEWVFDESLGELDRDLKQFVRVELASELDGSESPEEVAKLLRRLVREELDIE